MEVFPGNFRAAVSLTYDDALESHINIVGPALNRHDLQGTFFISDRLGKLRSHRKPWMQMRERGHEYGAHTLHHPCPGGLKWDPPGIDIAEYSMDAMEEDLRENVLLLRQLGEDRRDLSFAYPCGNTCLGPDRQSYIPLVRKFFASARSIESAIANPNDIDLHLVSCIHGEKFGPADLRGHVDKALAQKGWAVFMFHGVGGDYLQVSNAAHEALLEYLSRHQSELWIKPFGDVATYLAASEEE